MSSPDHRDGKRAIPEATNSPILQHNNYDTQQQIQQTQDSETNNHIPTATSTTNKRGTWIQQTITNILRPQSTTNTTSTNQHNKPPPPAIDTPTTNNLTTPELNLPIGNIMSNTKRPNTMRIYYQNIHGASTNSWLDWEAAAHATQKKQIDVFGYCETNLNWTRSIHNSALQKLRKFNKLTKLITSSSQEIGLYSFQSGGVATGIQNKWIGKIVSTIEDDSGMGRWNGFRLEGSAKRSLIIITAYRPTMSMNGMNTNYMQLWKTMRTNDIQTDPRQCILDDLEQAIKTWNHQGYDTILMIDLNDTITYSNDHITKFLTNTGLHPLHTSFPDTSYQRGKRCIDYMLGTNTIREYVTAAGYLPFYDGIWSSDHRGVFIDLNITNYLQGAVAEMEKPAARHLSSKNLAQATKFINKL